ncbi:MAG: SAM-dependent methyltransferase [Nitrospira sp.]|nr:SAM-dependent methyltransferase [Nitrospira sp.]
MPLDTAKTRQYIKEFDFKKLFIEELGWDRCNNKLDISLDGIAFDLSAVAEKHGMVAFICDPLPDGSLPEYSLRRKIERQAAKSVHEHIIIYTDGDKASQIWQWVKREAGKPTACREHTYHIHQPGDSLVQKLQAIAFSLEEEETLTIVEVSGRARAAFDVERITKRFYDRFKAEHDAFLKFIDGIPDDELKRWYASVMLNRLMFIYFIQKKGFLDKDENYLKNKLLQSKKQGKDQFYGRILCPLFFEGFAKKGKDRSAEINKLLGMIPYLNGGLFLRHQIEELHGKHIQIPDSAFEKLFDFFDQYQWHLDERPLKRDNEINPDVLGYIFEKYINQKQMGAYYTKEDITEYISKNTVIPFLFDTARQKCKIAFEGEQSVWRILQTDADRYFYPAVKKGVELPLPEEIAVGIKDVSKRTEWNKPAPPEYALPTEIWREVVARQQRYEEVKGKLLDGGIRSINDLITYNLDIRQFAQDVIWNSEGPELLRAFYHAIEKVTVLDPTCGSGAFLFAALNILEPLYEACLERMQVFLEELERSDEKHRTDKYGDFRKILKRVSEHPNLKYFIFKSIIVNNLYGVDIMEEAIEICKLRLFLKLVAQIDMVEDIEPLPDIDFNIRAGNTLVGFATIDELKKSMEGDWVRLESLPTIEEKAEDVDRLFKLFQRQQTELGGEVTPEDKQALRTQLKALEDELNQYLASDYGINHSKKTEYKKWLESHKPFHWFTEFYGILKNGGFDVIIGNPPYVEYTKVKGEYTIKGYQSLSCGNLYAFMVDRSMILLNGHGSFGFIVPISLVCTQRMEALQRIIYENSEGVWLSNYAERPSKLFVGAEVLLTIAITRARKNEKTYLFSTSFIKWSSEERPTLFNRITYSPVNGKPKSYVFPKLGFMTEISILNKIIKNNSKLIRHLRKSSKYPIYYRIGGGRYWKIFTNFQPRFMLNGKKDISSRENYLYLDNERLRDAVISILSSSLFYWYFILTTNCRDLNPSDLNEFPINLDNLTNEAILELTNLCRRLMNNYQEKSEMKEKTSSLTGHIVYQEFYPRLSKPIIDEIDYVLAKHYGFTDEEGDFITNYDIKYRMGRDSEEDT